MSTYDATFALCVAELRGEVALREDLAVRQCVKVVVDRPWGLDSDDSYTEDSSTFARAYGIVCHEGASAVLDVMEASHAGQ